MNSRKQDRVTISPDDEELPECRVPVCLTLIENQAVLALNPEKKSLHDAENNVTRHDGLKMGGDSFTRWSF